MPKRVTKTSIDLSLGRRLQFVAANLVTFAVIAVMALALTHCDLGQNRLGDAPEPHDPPGSGVIVRSEVLTLSLPQALIDFAHREFRAASAPTHQDCKIALESRQMENLWYAITIRGHQVNGRSLDLTYIRYPNREPDRQSEFQDVLATVTGHPPRYPAIDYSQATVELIPSALTPQEFQQRFGSSAGHEP